MEAVQKDNWYSLALLTFLIFLKASLQDRGETVTLADGMVLDCMCPWNGNLSMVSWTKVPDKTALAIFHPSYGTTFGDGYDERLMFLRKSTMDGSISFGNVTEQDAGLYRCSMQTFPLGTWTRDVRVIKESHSPYVELDFSEGENLTIVCPHHNYSVMHALIKKDENETVGRCTMQAGALVAEDLHEGIQMNCADPILGVTFDLNNVAESDQGLYQCLLTTEDGVEITNYLLTVRHEVWSVWEWAKEIHEQYWIYIYAGAAGVALLLIVLIVVLVIVCRRRRRRRREALRVRTHPGKRWRDSEMGGFYDRLRRGTRFGRQEPVYANVRTGPKSKHKPKTKRRR
ncbi:CD226 antigen isoform X2 [Engraulis encrasicolus]|uniref:CD226 antigen isoform X2 n=1 Tax=Engraulis encrasicolus TaxID=184585 RepID=UPI002FD021B2